MIVCSIGKRSVLILYEIYVELRDGKLLDHLKERYVEGLTKT